MSPNLSNGYYTVRWTGQVQPQFSETYFFDVSSDDGCRLWVNDQLLIDKWRAQGVTDWTNAIALQAGTRYDMRLDYLQDGGCGAGASVLVQPEPAEGNHSQLLSCIRPTVSATPVPMRRRW